MDEGKATVEGSPHSTFTLSHIVGCFQAAQCSEQTQNLIFQSFQESTDSKKAHT
jgi:hypothetical protein